MSQHLFFNPIMDKKSTFYTKIAQREVQINNERHEWQNQHIFCNRLPHKQKSESSIIQSYTNEIPFPNK